MGCVFICVLARLRCINGKLVFFQILVQSSWTYLYSLDLYYRLTRQNLGSILVKPRAMGIALGLAYYILLFPQSTSHAVLEKMEKPKLKDAKARSIAVYKAMEPELAFLPLDCSRSRWNAKDVKGLQEPVVRQR
ncbi:hypothetical protein ACCO45_012711 [Purpureocillium lilacinum]|uniref:Uncharacterized protein n=1 Tax=Purpureocillium lilacinum TaxID=33203 RepID=A0ACC4D9G1_PURLI